jgi:hypothetical protein
MVFRGTVRRGKVVLTDSMALPDGTEVEVRPVKKRGKTAKTTKAKKERPRSLAERLAPFIGKAKGLPADMSVNLDHYLYGQPKRK